MVQKNKPYEYKYVPFSIINCGYCKSYFKYYWER